MKASKKLGAFLLIEYPIELSNDFIKDWKMIISFTLVRTKKYRLMKKTLTIFILAIFTIHSYAQYEITKDSVINQYLITILDSMGIDDKLSLNKYEIEYFNAKYQKKRKDFDFTDKKVAFNSPGGGVMKNKSNYFITEKDRCLRGCTSNFASLILFDKRQKEETGGYDAVIYYWTKPLRDAKYYVKRLKKEMKNNSSNFPTN